MDIQVSYAYPNRPSELALTNANLRILAGKTTFIVGKSGSGKSTLGSLICNIYQPLSGNISIDGNSTKILDDRWIREHISLVHSQSALFDETVFRNISFGRKDYENVTKDEVVAACKMAALDKTVLELPDGLDTTVGLDWKRLSGGQLQRVGLDSAIGLTSGF